MKIALNTTIADHTRTGTGHYAANLTAALMQLSCHHQLLVYCNERLRDWFKQQRNGHAAEIAGISVTSSARRIYWEQRQLNRDLSDRGVDLLHSMSFTSPWFRAVKTVVTVHDLVFRRYPETIPVLRRSYYQALFSRSLRQADAVITPSHVVREEVLQTFVLAPESVFAIPEAVGSEFFNSADQTAVTETLAKYGIRSPYLLTVGTLEPRKNLPTLVRAFNRLKQSDVPHQLVIAGKAGWLQDKTARDLLHNTADVILTGYVEQAELPALYAGADLFLFPSLYEGFGLPLLEAFAAGVSVVASDISVHREVCGDCARFVPADDDTAWANTVRTLLDDRGERARMTQEAEKRARAFTWKKTAEKTLEVYQWVEANGKT